MSAGTATDGSGHPADRRWPEERPARPERGAVGSTVVAVTAALAVGLMVLVVWFPNVVVPDRDGPIGQISSIYDPPKRSVEVVLNIGDGQIFATQAVDPVPTAAGRILGGPEERAYRYQRGAYGWIGWVASGGRADAVPWALAVVTALSVAGLVGVTAEVVRRRGGPPFAALLVLLLPGTITDLLFVGPEALGTALVVAGYALWRRAGPGATWSAWGAVALFAAAGLCRETLLLVPAALALAAVLRGRWAEAMRLALAVAPYAAWVALLRVRLGAWPVGSSQGRLVLVPFRGALEVAAGWGPEDIAGIALMALLAGLGLARTRALEDRLVLGLHVVLAATLGPAVWSEAAHVGRVLLPLAVLGLVVAAVPAGGEPAVETRAEDDGAVVGVPATAQRSPV